MKTHVVSTCSEKQQNIKLLSQLDDLDQTVFIGDAMSNRRQTAVVNIGLADREYTGNYKNSSPIANENAVVVQT